MTSPSTTHHDLLQVESRRICGARLSALSIHHVIQLATIQRTQESAVQRFRFDIHVGSSITWRHITTFPVESRRSLSLPTMKLDGHDASPTPRTFSECSAVLTTSSSPTVDTRPPGRSSNNTSRHSKSTVVLRTQKPTPTRQHPKGQQVC